MYTPDQRRIFSYFDGKREVKADPIALKRRLLYSLDGDVNRFLRDAKSEDPNARFHALNELVEAARFTFEMDEWNKETGEGANEAECLKALSQFLRYENDLKKNMPMMPISVPPTEDLVADLSLTSNTSACG